MWRIVLDNSSGIHVLHSDDSRETLEQMLPMYRTAYEKEYEEGEVRIADEYETADEDKRRF